ncbi:MULTISPECIES: hypothetical protein [unclassified Sphingobium]|uniref:hypothetical protein n=1 Tax=unclassified Sphingobium TaxID=2611147 RepID=UPI0035A5FDC5
MSNLKPAPIEFTPERVEQLLDWADGQAARHSRRNILHMGMDLSDGPDVSCEIEMIDGRIASIRDGL